jgi:AraC family transcriptional regulator of adaptative response / DNA-3-methyladenine glycosylase II
MRTTAEGAHVEVLDEERCARAVASRDARFDGWFVTAVTSTGIYCRPSCPAMTPKREHLRFFTTAAAAQHHGFRACKRCRPDATPGSPEWNARGDVVARGMRLIADGVVDREGVRGLATRLGYSERQLNRLMTAELGAGPLALARAQRAHTARLLIETSDLALTDVAFAAGFGSIRQFNDTVRAVFDTTPTLLRERRRPRGDRPISPGSVVVRLSARAPFDAQRTFTFLGARAVRGVESWDGTTYARTLDLPHAPATVELSPIDGQAAVQARLALGDWRDLTAAVQRCRRLLDLDADPVAVDAELGRDPLLAPLVRGAPGVRSPGAVCGSELAIRAVLGQQVSVAAARTLAGRLVADVGEPLLTPSGALTHLFPAPGVLSELDPGRLAMPQSRRATLRRLAAALADGSVVIDPGAERGELAARLTSLTGIGPWTASYIAMRGLGDPDVFLPTDVGVRRALERLGAPSDPTAVSAQALAWRPWRSYALHHLWGALS